MKGHGGKPHALVTGAGRRLGLAFTRHLLEKGWKVTAHYRTSGAELEKSSRLGEELFTVAADLETEEGVRKVLAAVRRHNRLDLLLNNASVFYRTPINQVAAEDFHLFYHLHVVVPFLLANRLRDLLVLGRGLVVNITDSGARRYWQGYLPYCLSKNSLEDLTRALAVQLGPEIRVNAIAPGHILASREQSPAEEHLASKNPLGREGKPEDLLRALDYLLEAEFVTGEILDVNGGRDLRLHGN